MNKKAIVMLSGGLDSTLAARMMLDQEIDLVALNFVSIFCTCTSHGRKKSGCASEAVRVGKELGIPVKTIPKGMDYFRVVENPRYGYGKGMNPCIDCRIYMLSKAKDLMPKIEASFIITGEVLGQRPMSQHLHQMKTVEKNSALEGLILRPLSAALLPETIPEKLGVVDRKALLNIHGRSRKKQIAIAGEMGINDYSCASGGCLLTDKIFARRVKDLFNYKKNYTLTDLKMLKIGRHFRIDERTKFIIGRNEEENNQLEFNADGNPLLKPVDIPGPVGLVSGHFSEDKQMLLASIIFRYSDVSDGTAMMLQFKHGTEIEDFCLVGKKERGAFEKMII